MASNPTKSATPEQLEELAKKMARETILLIQSTEKIYGTNYLIGPIGKRFLAFYIACLVHKALSVLDADGKTTYDTSRRSFAHMKQQLQEAVSSGFDMGMSLFTGKAVEYYCDVKLIPEDSPSKANN